MDNYLIATVDENWNQFVAIDGVYKFISKVPEFNNIIEQRSEGGIFFIDYDGYVALGYNTFPLRPTRVFLREGEELEEGGFCVTSAYADLNEMIGQNHNKTIFFMGSPNFVADVLPHVTRISVCVGSQISESSDEIKFPIELTKEYFLGRVEEKPKMLDSINKLKELGGLDENDKLFKCPSNYTFFEYVRSRVKEVGSWTYHLKNGVVNFMMTHQPPQPIAPIYQNETINISGTLSKNYGFGDYPWTLSITIKEKHTRYKKGENFANDKSDVVSFIEDSIEVMDFKYKSTNGMVKLEEQQKFDDLLIPLANKHLVGEDIWDITF